MKSYDVKTNMDVNGNTKSYDVKTNMDVNGNTAISTDITTDEIKPTVFLEFANTMFIGSHILSSSVVSHFGIENNISLQCELTDDGIVAEKSVSVNSNIGMKANINDIIFYSPSNTDSGFLLPEDNDDHAFSLIGFSDMVYDFSIFDSEKLYVNLYNIQNICENIGNQNGMYEVVINDKKGTHTPFQMSISGTYVQIYLGYADGTYIDYSYKPETKIWEVYLGYANGTYIYYSYDPETKIWKDGYNTIIENIGYIDNFGNIKIIINNFSQENVTITALDNEGEYKTLDKTLISSYPFDCSNLSDGLNIYTVFYKINNKWEFQPDIIINEIPDSTNTQLSG